MKTEILISGKYVETKTGKKGRTYNNLDPVNGKVIVYPERDGKKFEFEEKGILCDPKYLKIIGYID